MTGLEIVCLIVTVLCIIVFIVGCSTFGSVTKKCQVEESKNKSLSQEVSNLKQKINFLELDKDRLVQLRQSYVDLNEKFIDVTLEKTNLEAELDKMKTKQEISKDNNKSLLHISNLVIEKTQELKELERRCELAKEDVSEKQKTLTDLESQIESLATTLQQRQAAWNAVDSFEKCGFGNELPYIDYEEYLSKNNFEVVLKLLDDCVKVAPQFKTELRKIEWNLCYLPYKKTFIKDFSRSGIYMLEVKNKYESEVLKELGLKRVSNNGSIVYIGQAVNIYDRWTTHIKKMLGIEAAGGEKIYKFKPETFIWRILEVVDKENLDEREKYWIDWFKSNEVGLNSKGGNGK